MRNQIDSINWSACEKLAHCFKCRLLPPIIYRLGCDENILTNPRKHGRGFGLSSSRAINTPPAPPTKIFDGEERNSSFVSWENQRHNGEIWLVPSRPHVNQPEEKRPGSSWPPKLQGRARPLLAASRSPIDIGLVLLLCERSVGTRSPLSCSSGSSLSSAWSGRSLRTSRQICVFRAQPLVLCRKPVRHTWLGCLRTQTCVLFMQRGLPSCPRTFSWPGELEESVLK
ncbi:hypothetical protein LDENG_00259080 [Lucifuga dentata]|nr:hypothetical protein LDENG_00259080 [Lucifuga dentata]